MSHRSHSGHDETPQYHRWMDELAWDLFRWSVSKTAKLVLPHQTCHNFSWRVDKPLSGPPYPRLSEVMQRGSEAWGMMVEKIHTNSMNADLNDNTNTLKMLDVFEFWCIDRILIATNSSCRTTFVLERILTLVQADCLERVQAATVQDEIPRDQHFFTKVKIPSLIRIFQCLEI